VRKRHSRLLLSYINLSLTYNINIKHTKKKKNYVKNYYFLKYYDAVVVLYYNNVGVNTAVIGNEWAAWEERTRILFSSTRSVFFQPQNIMPKLWRVSISIADDVFVLGRKINFVQFRFLQIFYTVGYSLNIVSMLSIIIFFCLFLFVFCIFNSLYTYTFHS